MPNSKNNGRLEGSAAESINLTANEITKHPRRKSNDETTPYKGEIVWTNVIGFALLHLTAACSLYPLLTLRSHFFTLLWATAVGLACSVGVGAGAHRLFTHRAYEASAALRCFLVLLHTVAGQNCLYVWVRDHRQHHKYSETNADPHNSTRGFFFSHMGWLMMRKHPDVIKYGNTIDMSDLEADHFVMFQKRHYKTLYAIFSIILPVLVPWYFWDENIVYSFLLVYMGRNIVVLHCTWLVNSAAHMYGIRPYDKNIAPVEIAIVSYMTGGEGWHNFHHAFPWDYRAAELGPRYNTSRQFIELCAKLGLASNLRCVSEEVLKKKVRKTGDGRHGIWGTHNTLKAF